MNKELILVTGGARSGKSEFAERLVLHYGRKCAYIATAEIFDDEMAERVRLHQERRSPQRWNNYEAPYAAEQVMDEAGQGADAILFDCLTLYMSNLMYGKAAAAGTFEEKVIFVKGEIAKLLEAARKTEKLVVFVTNEVGSGIVPDNIMAREYRDLAGWVNQQVAAECDRVFYCVAGQAIDVKKMAFNFDGEGAE
ncbi:MAG: bifunctional adenosylcobinamide kinase/adenosylcobinamide-phosphate guanylyltransferase [Phascolarctobacterium sp.]|uniref:bifunctional adenosylcobinamide kinase/adenosylcobinamide-phosphate guanylyltransferase n=1 Tax=Phascolarctobacterium sp. TaxID=2049039 RepID=UPI0025F563EC|nr:bifunctional adenosylcobinamide kinase/adenosylcobinamide-phosphate guanylyltransferase [Phascolarctobacterium sp.]MCC8158981.1 bifunctional adenosylcobinamide kinase/adenosylcobinamide-phosphate guanylyltransferase [Phascolarctobacterium sp.]